MPDDHSEVEPLLPIPNRTVKRLCADDSDHSIVKVGHRQAIQNKTPAGFNAAGVFSFSVVIMAPETQRRSHVTGRATYTLPTMGKYAAPRGPGLCF